MIYAVCHDFKLVIIYPFFPPNVHSQSFRVHKKLFFSRFGNTEEIDDNLGPAPRGAVASVVHPVSIRQLPNFGGRGIRPKYKYLRFLKDKFTIMLKLRIGRVQLV